MIHLVAVQLNDYVLPTGSYLAGRRNSSPADKFSVFFKASCDQIFKHFPLAMNFFSEPFRSKSICFTTFYSEKKSRASPSPFSENLLTSRCNRCVYDQRVVATSLVQLLIFLIRDKITRHWPSKLESETVEKPMLIRRFIPTTENAVAVFWFTNIGLNATVFHFTTK